MSVCGPALAHILPHWPLVRNETRRLSMLHRPCSHPEHTNWPAPVPIDAFAADGGRSPLWGGNSVRESKALVLTMSVHRSRLRPIAIGDDVRRGVQPFRKSRAVLGMQAPLLARRSGEDHESLFRCACRRRIGGADIQRHERQIACAADYRASRPARHAGRHPTSTIPARHKLSKCFHVRQFPRIAGPRLICPRQSPVSRWAGLCFPVTAFFAG